jgi:DNA polymerase I-like protein with 3'-5' exonuclease and polymerase domains
VGRRCERSSTVALDKWEAQIDIDLDNHIANIKELSADNDFDKKIITSHVKLKTFLRSRGFNVAKTDRTELSKFKNVPLIKAISDFKQANTAKTKFIAGIRKSLEYNESNSTHPSCRLWNTYTGRIGYTSKTLKKFPTGIALHQFPRKPEARDCISAPDGFLLIEWDFATQESRIICDFSGDEVLYDIFSSGKDFHTYMASIIANIEYLDMLDRIEQKDKEAKNFRQLAKVANLSCQYRTGWKTLIDVARTQFDTVMDDRQSQQLVGLYRDTYKRVPQYWDDSIRLAKSVGYAESRGGRRVFIDDWSRAQSWSSESTAINFPIQGTGADMKFLGISQVDEPLYEVGGHYLFDLHDALFALVPDTSAGFERAVQCKEILSNLPYQEYFGWKPRVALPVDMKYGKAWGSLKELK